MNERVTLARPYAKAAYEFAKSASVIEQWSNDLSVAGGLAENEEIVVQRLSHLQSLGFQISVDDYGIGQSSLSKLKTLFGSKLLIPKVNTSVSLSSTLVASVRSISFLNESANEFALPIVGKIKQSSGSMAALFILTLEHNFECGISFITKSAS